MEAEQEWISVDDRLPEECQEILIPHFWGFVTIARFIGGHFWSIKRDGFGMIWKEDHQNHTSHWMPLPELPKEYRD